jgi:uncharacterized protein YjbI with pentapeptide repeats
MSEQQSQSASTAASDTKQEGPFDREPAPERQAELRAAYAANVAAGKPPYAGVKLRTRGELNWVMQERQWSGDRGASLGISQANLREADLSFANLSKAELMNAYLTGADFRGANLSGADLYGADLSRARLDPANLSGGGPLPRQCE